MGKIHTRIRWFIAKYKKCGEQMQWDIFATLYMQKCYDQVLLKFKYKLVGNLGTPHFFFHIYVEFSTLHDDIA
jgi:hypothetical protein